MSTKSNVGKSLDLGTTFKVDDVSDTGHCFELVGAKRSFETLCHAKMEAASDLTTNCVAGIGTNPLATAVSLAFRHHKRLVFTPDAIWQTVLQGLGEHLYRNSDQARTWIGHQSPAIVVNFDTSDFPTGSPEASWDEFVWSCAEQILNSVSDEFRELFQIRFSTTTKASSIAMHIAMMSAVRDFTQLNDYIICGIPEISLQGSHRDWQRILDGAQKLSSFGLDWWLAELSPILSEFLSAAKGSSNRQFWSQIYSSGDSCAIDLEKITGWIRYLFPYEGFSPKGKDGKRARWFDRNGEATLLDFPKGQNRFQFTDSQGRELSLWGGYLGIAVEPESQALEPYLGWGVSCTKNQNRFSKLLSGLLKTPGFSYEPIHSGVEVSADTLCPFLKQFAQKFRSARFINQKGRPVFEFEGVDSIVYSSERSMYKVAKLTETTWVSVKTVSQYSVNEVERKKLGFQEDRAPKYFAAYFLIDSERLDEQIFHLIGNSFGDIIESLLAGRLDPSQPLHGFESYGQFNVRDCSGILECLCALND